MYRIIAALISSVTVAGAIGCASGGGARGPDRPALEALIRDAGAQATLACAVEEAVEMGFTIRAIDERTIVAERRVLQTRTSDRRPGERGHTLIPSQRAPEPDVQSIDTHRWLWIDDSGRVRIDEGSGPPRLEAARYLRDRAQPASPYFPTRGAPAFVACVERGGSRG